MIKKLISWGTLFLVVWYVFLCLTHFSFGRPLWNDEECVFLSVKNFSSHEMFHRTLMAIQVFPRVYLFLIQQVSQLFGHTLFSLRLLPLIAMLAAFAVWLKIGRQIFKEKFDYFIFVLCWTASVPLIYYSAELKQYSMDVLTGGLFILFILNQEELSQKGGWKYGLSLMLLPFLGLVSYPGFILAMLPLYHLVILSWKDRQQVKYLLVYLAVLALTLGISYQFDMRLREADVLTREWGNHFIQTNSIGSFFQHFGEGFMNLFTRWFVERPKFLRRIVIFFVTFGMFYLFIGFFKNYKKDRYMLKSLETIGFFLFIELVILGILKKYPFTVPRTSLFFSPVVFYLIINGIRELRNIHRYAYYLVNGAFVCFLLFLTAAISRLVMTDYLGAQSSLW